MDNINGLFERFVKEKKFLLGVTPKTERWYRQSWNAFTRTVGSPEILDRFVLNDFVIRLRESGISPTSVNVYTCAINSFLSWLWENGHISERLKIKEVKAEKKIIQVFSDSQLETLISYRPKDFYEHRLHTMILFAIDTGARIEEMLTLTRDNVDFNNLLIRLAGKGQKERIVPLSLELRKGLFKFMRRHDFNLVFCTRHGDKLSYRNSARDFKSLCDRLGIVGVRTSWHTLRHGFALNHVRQGGNVFVLQKMLGHSSLQMTRRYCELTPDDLKASHQKTSILSRLK
jgi:integrase/recombinase XerD